MSAKPSPPVRHPGGITVRDLLPLVGFAVPTLVVGYGVVMPRHGITGANELTVGFGSAVAGACVTYIAGLRSAVRRRTPSDAATTARRWSRPVWIARQSARPRGWVGWLVGRVMRADTAAANDRTIALAEISAEAQVLDVGCGPGYGVRCVAERLGAGRVVGVDRSPAMVRMARRLNVAAIAARRADVRSGDADRLPVATASVDRVLSTHTIYFWPELAPVLAEVARVLRPGGRLVLCFGDAGEMACAFPASVYRLRSTVDIRRAVDAAGFVEVSVEMADSCGHRLYWLVAHKPMTPTERGLRSAADGNELAATNTHAPQVDGRLRD